VRIHFPSFISPCHMLLHLPKNSSAFRMCSPHFVEVLECLLRVIGVD
jgi:hypothetical protein